MPLKAAKVNGFPKPRRQAISERHVWRSLLIVGLVVLGRPGTSADETKTDRVLSLDRAAIRDLLIGFNPPPTERMALQRQLEGLDSPDYVVRQRAMATLLSVPIVPPSLLKQADSGGSTEVRLAVRRIRATQSPEKIDLLLRSAYAPILEYQIKGLCAEVIATLPFADRLATRRLGQSALAATVEPDDAKELRTMLSSDNPVVRQMSVTVLANLVGDDAIDDLLPMTNDADSRVRLEAATALGNLNRRDALTPLIRLLNDETFLIRWKARETLRALTDHAFDYVPAAPRAIREQAIERWQGWVADNHDKIKLVRPIHIPTQIRLFRECDFSGWTAVTDGHDGSAEGADPSKTFEIHGDILSTRSKRTGDLRMLEAFADYRLRLEFRILTSGGDSGIGVALADASALNPPFLEVQLHPNSCGDLYVVNGMQATANGVPIDFRAAKMGPSNERYQQWNALEVTLFRGNIHVAVNGEPVNAAEGLPTKPSHVSIRNEGSRVDFRNIFLEPLE